MSVMKVDESDNRPDRFGNYPIRFTGYKNLEEVHSWLFQHYNGYHFVIILDETKDEYMPLGRELLVYFSDTVLPEIAEANDYELVKKGVKR